ncbi:MAG: hypothetical protein KJO11_11310 [Gemmatimonadetes bacterium]|nr:hypothetical protein [Gemmatimonadota bacterium]MBT8404531.1 hypothetical protein [Gemmatimonadota bacterium]
MPDSSWFQRLRQTKAAQILVFYLGTSWVVLQVADIVVDALRMPEWVMPVTLLLLLVGLVFTLATAWVQSLPSTTAAEEAGEVPDDWEVAPSDMLASLRAGQLPHLTWGRTILSGVVALSLLFGGAGVYVALTGRPALLGPQAAGASEVADGIAVVPFEVRGSDLEVWREGMIDLLSNNLDGVGGFRTIDPRTVLARWSDEVGDDETVDLDAALRVAGATGARYALVGSVVGTGDQVRLSTTVYDLDSGDRIAQARSEGSAEEILPLTDELAVSTVRGLLDALGRDAGGALVTEDLTTESLPALRHFLEGERLFRTAQFAESVRSYEAALAEDSTFVLAMARVSDAYGWLEDIDSEEADRWGTAALERVEELPPRLELYVRANDALINASVELLPDLREAVRLYPDDPEAWFLLAETIFHLHGPAMAPVEDAARAFDEAVALDPGFTPYLQHVADMAIMMGDREKAQAALDRYRAVAGPDAERFVAHAAIGIPLLLGTEEEAARAVDAAREADARTLDLLLGTYGTRTDRFDRIEAVLAAVAGEGPLNRNLLWSMGSRGAFSQAEAFADSGTVRPFDRLTYLARIGAVWGASSDTEAFQSLLDPANCETNAACSVYLAPALAQTGRWDDADAVVTRTRALVDRQMEAGDSSGLIFADVAEGRTAVVRGDDARARRLLDPWKDSYSIFGEFARSGLAEVARREERWTAAVGFYSGLLGGYSRPLGLYGLAKVAEARGDDDEARRYWRSFVTLTAEGDPERTPRIREGREALERLGG